MAYRLLVGAALCLLSVSPVVSQAQTITFVDQGAPSTTLLDGSTVRVRVVDSASNTGLGRDSVTATVTSDLAGDSESVSLLETGPETGVFEGLIDLEPDGSPTGPTLATATSPGPPAVRDTVHATYGSATASAGLVGSTVRFIDEWGRDSSSFAVGHRVDLRVRDELRNNPLSVDLVTVGLTSQAGGDSHTVGLRETGMNTGVFESPFVTDRLPASPNYLDVGVPDTITATLAAGDGVGSASDQAQIAGAVIVLLDADGNPVDTFAESARVRIRVIDPAFPGSVSLQVTSDLTGDSETVVLPGYFVYDGGIETEIALGTPPSAVPGDGVLQITEVEGPPIVLDTVTVTYTGAGVSASAGFIPGRLAFLDSHARVTSSYAAGTEVRIRLEHPHSDTMFLDQVTVRLVNAATGEEEYVQLHETRHDSGVFTGSFPLTVNGSSQWHDGSLNAQPGEQIQVQHGDIVQTAEITDLSLEFLDEWGEPTDEIVESGTARVRMWSTSSNGSPSSADSASAEMRVLRNGDLETLTLTETGPDTNVFEGSMSLEMGSFSNPDGKLQTANTGPPDYRSDEVTAQSGPVEATAQTVGARILFLDAYGRRTTSYAAGDTVRLRIVDHFRSAYGPSFQVSVASLLTGDVEPVTLQETAPGSGIFEGSIPTTTQGGTGADGKLRVDFNFVSEIEVRHATGFSPIELTKRASIVPGSVLFVDAAGQPATTYLEGTRAYVRVVSSFANFSSFDQETVTVDLLAELSQDQETLTLTETGLDTGVFEGSIQLQLINYGPPSTGNGILETTETGYIGYHAFDTLRATFNSTIGWEPAVARIDLTGSRTWLGNAAGDEVLAFRVGGTAYVWVEDQVRNTPGQWDQVQAEVRSFSSPSSTNPDEIETVTLQETTRDSGIFRVAVPLPAGFSSYGDGQVGVQPGGQIEARHQDSFGATWSTAVADITDGSIEFVDDAGEATAELLESGTARVRLFNLTANASSGTVDTAVILVESGSGDEELLTLTETGPDTSVFEGSIPMATSYWNQNNGSLETSNSGPPEYRPDEVTARYGPSVRATARVLGARVTFFDAYGRATASYAAGESVRVRVVDHNANQPGNRDTVPVTVQAIVAGGDGGDQESLTLQETGFDTAVFEGVLPTIFGSSAFSFDNVLGLQPGNEIEARYQPYSSPNLLEARAEVTGNDVLFIDAAGQPATVYLESSRAFVRVVSGYSNTPPYGSPSSPDTVSVQVAAGLSGDQELVSLTETGPNTGVFEGSIQMRLTPGGAQQGNDLLETVESGHPQFSPPHQFDTLTATFADPAGTSTDQIGLTGSRTWFADASGQEVLSYPVGGTAYVRVEDQNGNDPETWDRVQVQVLSPVTGDQESLMLDETSRTSGVFVRAVELTTGAPSTNDGRLSVSPGGQIEAIHQDYQGATYSSAVADIADGSIEFVDAAGEPTAELLESGEARVRLFRIFSNFDSGMVDTAGVTVQAQSGDQVNLVLTETGADTGVFEGTVQMVRGSWNTGNSELETTNSGFPEYRSDVVTVSYGPSIQATARVLAARMTFFDGYGRETTSFAAGETVRVRLVDHNVNTPQSRETAYVMLTSRDGGDSEPLTLQETGFDTAIFEGAVPSVFGGSTSPSDGQLRVYPEDRIEADYPLPWEPKRLFAQASVTGNAVLFIDTAGQPATVYLESSRALVRVVSPYINTIGSSSPTTVDMVSVQVVGELSGDQELVSLTETGPNTGVFEGSIQMRLTPGGAQQGNDLLETVESGHPQFSPPHEFDTLRATYIDPAGTSVARVGLTGSRTWFADASGQEVLSYPVGGTAYVRVEDQNGNDPETWDRVQVQVLSPVTGDQESLMLDETSRTSGVFVRAVELTTGAPSTNDGRLSVSPGGQIEAIHQDYQGATYSSAVANIADGSIEFVDAAGEPTAELLESGEARVRLFRIFSNFSSSTVDTAGVTVQAQSGDQVNLVLTETGADTGVFEGTVQMVRGSWNTGNSELETTNSGFPEYRPDVVTVSYGPSIQATAQVLAARMTFFDGYGRETSSFAAGETVRVRVVDHNVNTPQSRETAYVMLTSQSGGDSEPLTLEETGFDTAVFEGAVPSVFGGSTSPSDGRLRVYPEDRIEADYPLPWEPNRLFAQASVTGNAMLFIDTAGQPATVYLESSRAYLRVVSSSANTPPYGDPSTVNQVSVQVVGELSGDQELVSLTETGPNTGVFEGSIQMRLTSGGAQQGNDLLETVESGHPQFSPPHEFDTLRATYIDPAGTSVARVGLTGSRTWFADASGQEVLSYPVGGTAYVRVEDQNGNDPETWDRVQVQVVSPVTGDQESLMLDETSRTSGVFVRAVELTTGAPSSNDGRLSVSPGGQIEAIHQDYQGATYSSAVANIADGSIEFVDAAGEPTAELLESGEARVRLFRIFSNFSSSTVDTAGVTVQAQSGDQVNLVLTETGADTGVFEGTVQMVRGSWNTGNSELETTNSGFPEYRPDVVTVSYGPSIQATAQVLAARMTFFDGYGRETSSFAAGETVRVRLVDHNVNTPQSRETAYVMLTSRDGGDSEPLTLEETGFDTAVFEGAVPSVFGGSTSPSDGRLRVYPEDRIEADYPLPWEPKRLFAQASVTGNAMLFIDTAGQPATVYLESSRAYLRVVSASANTPPYGNPSTVNQVSVQVVGELSGDQELVSLTETGPNTGVFEGSIQMRLTPGGAQQGNDLLETVESGHPQFSPPHEFDTLRATYIDPAGTSVARVGLTGSRTWFADASGQEVLSYPVGGTAYVRVEDQNGNDPETWDRVQVQVLSPVTGDQESLMLDETSRTSGVFVRAVELTTGAPSSNDGRLSVSPGGQIEATHQDYQGATYSSAVANIADGSIEFVDAAGEPTAELLESGEARVRLFRIFSNFSSSTVDTAGVVLQAQSGDEVNLVLTETGADTGVFEGTVQMVRGSWNTGNSELETTNSGFPEYRPDVVTVSYGPSIQATARVLAARMTFFDGYGRETSSFAAGETVRVRVVDHNVNTPQSRETAYVMLTSRDGGDSEPLTLEETGFDTAVFEGAVPSVFGGSTSPSDGRLRIQPGDRIEADYALPWEPNRLFAHASVTGNAVLFIDTAGQPATVYLESSRAYLRVVSSSANTPPYGDPSTVNQVSVQVVGELSGDQELVSLTETGPNTGVFEGSIQMRLTPGGAQQGNDLLETVESGHPQNQPPHEFDTLRATYSDPAGTSVARVGLTGSRTWFADASGQEVLSYPAGGTAYIRVEDQNGNDPETWDRVQVQVLSPVTGDQESLMLDETSRTSGVFVRAIELTAGTPSANDGRLSVSPGGQIEATHQDYQGATYSSAVANIADGSIEFVDAAGEPTAELLESGEARVRLFRIFSNSTPGAVDTAGVVLRAQSGDEVNLVLTETGADTGVFEGTVQMVRGPWNTGNSELETTNSGFPEYRPDVVTVSYGPSIQATARVLAARMTFFDGYGRETSSFAAGESVRVRVVDHNLNTPQSRETAYVMLTSRDGGDSEPLTLEETGFDTAVFEGAVPSVFGGSSSPSDGQLRVQPGDRIEADYPLPWEPNRLFAQASVTGNAVLFIDTAGQPATVYLESSRAYVRVVSASANTPPYGNPSTVDTVAVQIVAELSGDQEVVSLTETGPNTGVFEGSIQMRLTPGGAQQGNDLLETVESGHPQNQPPHEFDTLRATYSDPAGTSTARIGLTGSRTWFADASGQEVLSYPAGGTAYIRVEDQNGNDPATSDRVQVQVQSSGTGDQESLMLDETAPGSGIFAGSILLTLNGGPGDGQLQVAPGGQIEAIHQDYYGATFSSAVADVADGSIAFVDEAWAPTVELLEGGEARVRLFRLFSNVSPGTVDTAGVVVQSRSGDQESLVLIETGPDTAVFEGMIPLERGLWNSGNGIVETTNSGPPEYLRDEVTASYGPVSATATVASARIDFVNLRGQEVSAYALRSTVRVRVTDHGRNQDPGQGETFYIGLRSLASSDVEPVTMTETGPDTGVFEGSVPSTDVGSPSLDEILVAPPGQVEASHQPGFEPNPVLRQATILSAPAPTAADDTATTVEDEAVVIPVLANDTGNSALTVAAVTQPAHGSAAINPDGTVTYTPTAGYFGPDAFTYLIADAQGGEDVADVTVTVTPGNQAPTPAYDNATTPEDQSVVVSVLANDTDPDNDTLRVVAVTQPAAGGTVVINPDEATVTYTPAPDANGEAVFQYTVRDPEGLEGTSAVTVTITPVNDPPVANDDTVSTPEDTPVTVDYGANDSDIDSATYYAVDVTTPSHGTAEILPDHSIVYTPAPSFSGADSFVYTLQDDAGATDVATVSITVTSENDAPVANDDTATVAEESSVNVAVLANDTDAENDTLDVTAVTQGADGSVTLNPDETVTYAPNADFSGTDSFTYTVSDGNGGTDTATVTVTVTGENDAPVANDDTATTAEDEAVSIAVLGNDTDSDDDTLQVDSVTQGDHGTVAINPDQTIRYTPAADFHGTDTFTYTASDGNGGTATATVTVNVTPVNDAPAASDDTATVAEDGTVAVPVLANDDDADDDTLTVTSVTQGAHGVVVINPDQTVRYTPAANYNGADTFTYTVSDGNGGTDTATVTVTVESDNDAPVAGADSATTAEDTAVTVTVLTNDSDPDNDALDVLSVTQGTHGTVTLNADETVTYTPALNFHGTDTFTYTVGDGNGGTDTETVTITVTPVNDAPAANDDAALVAEDGTVDVPVLANDDDADDDTLTVTSVTQGAHGAVVINPDQTVRYTPVTNYNGTDTFTYTIADGNGGTATATVTVTVGSDNDAPVAVADSATTDEDTAVTVTVLANDSDLDNDTLDVVSVTQGSHGTVTINGDETVTYTPALNFHGTDTFTYTVGDGNGGSATATVTITIAPVNDAPVANADAASATEDTAVTVPVLANDDDADDDTLTVTSVTQGAHGTVSIQPDQTVRYMPAANYNGTDSFNYTISDGNGGTATATVTVTIGSDNDAPSAGADSATTAEDTAVTVTVLANDSDLDNDVLDVVSVTQGNNGTVTLNANETVTYTPSLNFHGTDSFTYTVGDGNGGSATATVTITVTPVNDAPVANADAASASEDGPVTITVLGNDSDADNDTLNVTSVTQGAHGSVVINPNQTVTYTPAANYSGGDSFNYTINDGNGGTATATVTVTVNPVNDAPTANPDAATVAEDGSVTVTVLANDSDPENNTLSVASVTQGAHGSVMINPNQTVTYLPAANYNGGDSFNYTISDGNGGTATATVTVTVTAVNDAPMAVNDTATTLAETLVDIPVLSNDVDVDGPSLSIQSVTQPAHGTVSINANQTVRYTPASGYKGADSFTYIARDGVGGTSMATVNVTVNAPPRVTTNLQALYGFNEGSGTTVTDTSGVGTPLNLTIGSAAAVSWISGGLQINSTTLIESAGAATKIITASQSTNAITVEAWINPLNTSQTGPIATVSQQSNKLNVALSQSGNRWTGKLRTSSTNQAGTGLNSATGTATLNLTHVVYTRDASGNVRIYVNGVQSASTTLSGNFSSWTSNYKLGLVNELATGSPWRGKLYLVAFYNRALSSTEARQNWLAGE